MCYTGNWLCLLSCPPTIPQTADNICFRHHLFHEITGTAFLMIGRAIYSKKNHPFYPTLNKAHDRMCVRMHIHHTHTAHAYTLDNG